MKKKQIKVIYKKYGLANFFGDYIEINEKLKYNKPLRDCIIKHELGHSNKFDVKNEFDIPLGLKVIPFVIKNPSTWIDLLPIQIRNKQIIYDINLSIIYALIILLGIIGFKLIL